MNLAVDIELTDVIDQNDVETISLYSTKETHQDVIVEIPFLVLVELGMLTSELMKLLVFHGEVLD